MILIVLSYRPELIVKIRAAPFVADDLVKR